MSYLLTASDFSAYSVETPTQAGTKGTGGAVSLVLSDGTTLNVFDAHDTALKCLHYMNVSKLYSYSPSEDITILNLETKLLILENTFMNQKLMNLFTAIYTSGMVHWVTRSLASQMETKEAYQAVGYKLVNATMNNNYDWETNITDNAKRPHIHLVDWHYVSSPATSTDGSIMADGTPIVYDRTV